MEGGGDQKSINYTEPSDSQPTTGKIQSRLDEYNRLVQGTVSRDVIHQYISDNSVAMLKESTTRGQSLALECIHKFCAEADLRHIQSHQSLPGAVLDSYASVPSCWETIADIFECLELRNLSKISGDVLIGSIELISTTIERSANLGISKSITSKTGPNSKRLIGLIGISRLLVDRVPSFRSRIHRVKPKIAAVISVSALDRPLREACYSLLSEILTGSSEACALGLEPAQEKELVSRLNARFRRSLDSTLLIHPSNPPSSQDCPVTTPSLSSPRQSMIGKEWIHRFVDCAKWQEKRDRLVSLKETLQKHSCAFNDDFMSDYLRLFKEESNAPVLVAFIETVIGLSSLSSGETRWVRKLLFVTVGKAREKNPSVTRAVKTCTVSVLSLRPDFLDTQFIHHLAEVLKTGKKEILTLLLDIVQYIKSVSLRVETLRSMIGPAFDNGDTSIRESAIVITRQFIADTVSDQPADLEILIGSIETCTSNLSIARRKATNDALGLTNGNRETNTTSPSRPSSSSPGKRMNPARTPRGDSNVSILIRALMEGHSLVDPCMRIKEDIERSAVHDRRLIETIAKSVKPVLIGDDGDSRQAVLALLHTATRAPKIWESASVGDVRLFLEETLRIVDDKVLRQTEPEVWNDINLSLVNAISNCDRGTAYAALIEVSGPDASPSIRALSLKCIEKLNKALPQYFEIADPTNAEATFWSMLDHVLALSKNGTASDSLRSALKGICSAVHPFDIGEYLGGHVPNPDQRRFYKKLLREIASPP